MDVRRIALIGHSGAGKSACLFSLEIDRKTCDMDAVLGTQHCPPLASALDWLTSNSGVREIVVVSNHEQMLFEMRQAKLDGQHADVFNKFLLVYLHKPKDELREHLAKPSAGGRNRDPAGVNYTLDHYDSLHNLFCQLADRTVECSQKSIEDVATQIKGIAQYLRVNPTKPGIVVDGGT